MNFLYRKEWTSTKNQRTNPLKRLSVKMIVLHYPATPNNIGVRSREEIARMLRGWRDYHVNTHGWRDIGYNYAIDQSGRVWSLTGNNVGAHAGTIGNTQGVGILLIVGNNEKPSAAMINSFKALRKRLRVSFPRANDVVGHRQVPGNSTACPGKPVMELIKNGTFRKPLTSSKKKKSTVYIVTVSGVNVRNKPSTRTGKIVKVLPRGYKFGIVAIQGDWLKTTKGRYVHKSCAKKA